MIEYKHDGVVCVDILSLTVIKNGVLKQIPKVFIRGYGGDGSILITGLWAVKNPPAKKESIDMPKGKSLIGRRACMDAMCHSCENFNLLGRGDCSRVQCPMYSYMPYREHEPDTTWRHMKIGSAVGFVAAKGVDTDTLFDAATKAAEFRYGVDKPDEVKKALTELAGAAGAPVDKGAVEEGW